MQVQAVNRHAVKKYEEFQSAINLVRIALDESRKFVERLDADPGRNEGWQIPAREDVEAAFAKARNELDVLVSNAKKYEKELTARGWMV